MGAWGSAHEAVARQYVAFVVACGLLVWPGLALALAVPEAADAAVVTRYVAETRRNFDYTFTARVPAGIRVAVNEKDGSLAFRRGKQTQVGARPCSAADSEDTSGVAAIRADARARDAKIKKVRRGVFRAGSRYWVAVRGGWCLRFVPRVKRAAELARKLALQTKAELGTRATGQRDDPAGRALGERTFKAAAASQVIVLGGRGGLCAGFGLSCPRVVRADVVEVFEALDRPRKYHVVRVRDDREREMTSVLFRDNSVWVATASGCWLGPLPADTWPDLSPEFGLPSDPFAPWFLMTEAFDTSWRLRFDPPHARPDGTTVISWRSFWHRGFLVAADGRLRELDVVEREDRPGQTLHFRVGVSYPAIVDQVQPEPACPPPK